MKSKNKKETGSNFHFGNNCIKFFMLFFNQLQIGYNLLLHLFTKTLDN